MATIRQATATDIPALAELAKRTWSDAFGEGLTAPDLGAELEASRSEAYFADALRTKTILVAEAGGGLAGYVQFDDQALERLYVDTPVQGHGLGRRLLEAALRHPRLATAKRVFLQVWNENERAVQLYESVGFRKIGTTTFEVGSEVMEDAVMLLERS